MENTPPCPTSSAILLPRAVPPRPRRPVRQRAHALDARSGSIALELREHPCDVARGVERRMRRIADEAHAPPVPVRMSGMQCSVHSFTASARTLYQRAYHRCLHPRVVALRADMPELRAKLGTPCVDKVLRIDTDYVPSLAVTDFVHEVAASDTRFCNRLVTPGLCRRNRVLLPTAVVPGDPDTGWDAEPLPQEHDWDTEERRFAATSRNAAENITAVKNPNNKLQLPRYRPSFHCGIVFLTIWMKVRTPAGSLQRKRGAGAGQRDSEEREKQWRRGSKAWEQIQTPMISNKVGDQLPGAR
ncbi:hypothetical protein B0H14DRAFT_3128877 [Mycena olivaceomarginata]|nr:hypothetical protein B0H14DRAFT_3128877 [Mycena olivaceomarginata]